MDWLIIIGAIISIIGLVGLVASAVQVMRAKKAGLQDDALKARMQKALVLNMGALALSTLGLMVVVLGIFLA
ncbi:hypothetical protein [Aliiroseovarius sp.]|uniref:hypothetical protein n=1 Tax=Aliiroseovarius sp. TaxID=1872442 RepID=UPI003BABFB4B